VDDDTRQSATEAGDLTRDDLLGLLVQYNEATDRLRASHEGLKAEVARLTGELEQKNRELERRQRLAMLGEMASGVAHEIRNPLGGISLYADVLVDDLDALPDQKALAQRIQGGIRILDRIVEDMLLFARDLRLDLRTHRLDDLVRGALELARHEAVRSHLAVTVDPLGLAHDVEADGSLITRALLNMILNATQAAEGREGTSLRIGAHRDETDAAQVAIVLEDTCGGIDEADLPRLFNPFFTRREQGTGLGLAIVHRTVEAHGGRTMAANNAVGGATFSLTLPLAKSSGGAEAEADACAVTVEANREE
jgi:signal transduction histidine kinase